MPANDPTLQKLRVAIDDVDRRLVKRLNDRAELQIDDLSYGDNPSNQADESSMHVLDAIVARNDGIIPATALRGIYREIFSASMELARRIRVGYLGPEGTFSHQAAEQHFGDSVDYENLRALSGVFEEVARGHVEFGLVPIENSTGGAIIESLDSFNDYFGQVTICGEIRTPISFLLLGNCNQNEVKEIHSKAEALVQCDKWISNNFPNAKRVAAQSTAAAAQLAKLAAGEGVVAVGSTKAGEIYGLKQLADGIEDNPDNVTRFLVLARNGAKPTSNDKTSVMFTCDDRPGSLVDILSVFKRYSINLSHIEKRPSQQVDTDYTFFVDIRGHVDDGKTAMILGEVNAHCKSLHVLGSYPVANIENKYQPQSLPKKFETDADRTSAIHEIDTQIIDLVNERAKLVVEVGNFKRRSDVPIYAPHREVAVLKKIATLSEGPLPNRTLESIYRELMSGSFALEKPLRIGFLGPEGEHSHVAAVRQFGSSVTFVDSQEIRTIFDQVIRKEVDYGLVPIENTSVGGINGTLDAFIDYHNKISIYGEVKLQIHSCLLAVCKPDQVREVYSTAPVVAQCRRWLNTQYPQIKIHTTSSTANAIEQVKTRIAKDPDCGAAAIGSALAGEIHGLKPLFRKIEDRQNNMTRYLILSDQQTLPSGKDKTAIMFCTDDAAGSLVNVLDVFKRNSINLTHLDKRPSQKDNWEYTFFADLVGHREDQSIQRVLGEARAHCKHDDDGQPQLTILGSFPASQRVLS
jgi:chorismate mutase/prephenate dehydratase